MKKLKKIIPLVVAATSLLTVGCIKVVTCCIRDITS